MSLFGGPATATEMLRHDHKKISDLFHRFSKQVSGKDQESEVQMICAELNSHARLEEQLFFPAVSKAIGDTQLITQLQENHQQVALLIAQLQRLTADEDQGQYQARMAELKVAVADHVKLEEEKLFPQLEKSDLDLKALGKELSKLKA